MAIVKAILAATCTTLLLVTSLAASEPIIPKTMFGIRVVDEEGNGVPLVELRTVNEICCVSDNNGWIAWNEPGLMDQDVFWSVSGPGIEREQDGFGFRGFRAHTSPGTFAVCKVHTTKIAHRVGRITGQGMFRDSTLLEQSHPVLNLINPGVVGQDSVQAVPYNGHIFWLWGDTNLADYPLGNFHTTCATTLMDLTPESGFTFEYFRDLNDPTRLRRMMPMDQPGVVWMFGLLNIKDAQQQEQLFAGFSRRPGLEPAHEQGIARFDSEAGVFRKVADASIRDDWTIPHGNATRVDTDEGEHFYFCRPFAHVRVPASIEAISDPQRYQSLIWDVEKKTWRWQRGAVPTSQTDEGKLIHAGQMPQEQARYRVVDAHSGDAITLHTASIKFNEYRQCYVMIGLQIAHDSSAPSHLGEIWYAESNSVTGPWSQAVKVATHPDYSFYNPVHHTFLDQDGGRIIHFEGTYTKQFSKTTEATARYDYNQILYRLDLSDPRLAPTLIHPPAN